MINSHFIPRLILRHFPSKEGRISLYDLKSGETKLDVKIEDAFAIADFYPDEMEKEFNRKTEGSFGNLLNNIILKSQDKRISLTRVQVNQIKKFLLLLIIRSMLQDKWIAEEMKFESKMDEIHKMMGIKDSPLFPFKEKVIPGESPREYWLRSMECILAAPNGLPEEVEQNPDATQMAWRWAWVVKSGFLGFWSSRKTNVDFLVTDIGMTSESEMAVGKDMTLNPKKQMSLIRCAEIIPDEPMLRPYKEQFLQMAARQAYLHENFMEFPISKDLMIVLINPYYKVYEMNKGKGFPLPKLSELTKIDDEAAFFPNDAQYAVPGEYRDDDLFVYEIKDLSERSCVYLNLLTLDRIDTTLGFANSNKIMSSLASYQIVPGKLNDYSKLISKLEGGR